MSCIIIWVIQPTSGGRAVTDRLQAELTLSLNGARAWLDSQVAHLAEHDLQPTLRTEEAAAFASSYGSFHIHARGSDLRVRVESADLGGLEVLQETVSYYLTAHDPALAERMVWRGHDRGETRPANFRQMRVVARRLASPWMIRLTLQGRDIAAFAERGLHIRLLVPPSGHGRAPVWPRRARSGSVVFPEGEDALTVRVYTVRAIRPESGEIDVDVVRHAGGAVADWAEDVEPGAAVGVIGPGGGYFPEDGWLLIGGDETALPAIARILENRSEGAGGHAVIGVRHAEARMEIAAPTDVTIDWLVGDDRGLRAAMEAAALPPARKPVVWFAGEAETARHLRTVFRRERGLNAGQVSCSAYWRRDESA